MSVDQLVDQFVDPLTDLNAVKQTYDVRAGLYDFGDPKSKCLEINLDITRSTSVNMKDLLIYVDVSEKIFSEQKEKDQLVELFERFLKTVKGEDGTLNPQIKLDSISSFFGTCQVYPFGMKYADNMALIREAINAKNAIFTSELIMMFESIVEYLSQKIPYVKTFVMFIAESEKHNLGEVSAKLEVIYKLCQMHAVEFHVIGYGTTHDPYMLNMLANVGSVRGSYLIASDLSDVSRCLDVIAGRILRPAIAQYLSTGVESSLVKLSTYIEGSRMFCRSFGTFNIDAHHKLMMNSGRGQGVFDINPSIRPVGVIRYEMTIDYIYLRICDIITYVSNNTFLQGLKMIKDEIDGFTTTLNGVITGLSNDLRTVVDCQNDGVIVNSVSCGRRQVIIAKYKHVAECLESVYELIMLGYKKQITMELVGKVFVKLSEYDRVIVVSGVSGSGNNSNGKDNNGNGLDNTHTHTYTNIFDAADAISSVGDCVCAVVDGSDLSVHDEYVTYFDHLLSSSIETIGTLMKKVSHNMPLGQFLVDGTVAVEKSFGRKCVFPLYLSGKHFVVSQSYMHEAVSGILGYIDAQQIYSVPFKLLGNTIDAVLARPIESTYRVYKYVLDAIEHLFVELTKISPEFLSYLNKFYLNYTHPGSKCRTEVSDNKVFCAQVFCGILTGILPKFSRNTDAVNFFKVMIEEEMRRNLPAKYKHSSWTAKMDCVFDILNIDRAKYVDVWVAHEVARANLSPVLTNYALMATDILAGVPDDSLRGRERAVASVTPSIYKYDGGAAGLSNTITDSYDLNIVNFITRIKCHDADLFTDAAGKLTFCSNYLKLLTGQEIIKDAQNMVGYVCMILQNILQSNDRSAALLRSRFEHGPPLTPHYVIPWVTNTTIHSYTDVVMDGSDQRAMHYLRGLINELVATRIWREVDEALVARQNAAFVEDGVALFVSSSNILDAVGVLYGTKYADGNGVPDKCWKALSQTAAPLIGEKIRMLQSGEYNGKKLIKNAAGNRVFDRYYYQIWRLNREQLTAQMWCDVFPNHENDILCRYGVGKYIFDPQVASESDDVVFAFLGDDKTPITIGDYYTARKKYPGLQLTTFFKFHYNGKGIEYYEELERVAPTIVSIEPVVKPKRKPAHRRKNRPKRAPKS
jgi:hypothetical protein